MSTMKEAQVSEAVVLHTDQPVGAALPPADIKAPVTAAQAKVEAVANLTMQAYEKASTLKLTPEEVSALQADFPDSAFQPGAAGKEHLIYIEHAHLRDRLNQVFGPGQWAIIPRNRWAEPFTTSRGTEGSRVYVEAMLVIRGAFVSEAVGAMEYYPKNESQNYGDAVEGAKTAALRRCAKELGIGLQAWKKEWCEQWWARKRGGRDFSKQRNAPGRFAPSPDTRPTEKPPISQPGQAPGANPPPREAKQAIFADQDTLKRLLGNLRDCLDLATEYFRKLENPCVLLPNEHLTQLPLEFVPVTRRQFEKLMAAITDFGNGGEAKHAFAPNPLPPGKAPANKQKAPPKAAEPPPAKQPPPPSVQGAKAKDPEWFWKVMCPIPNKGQKRDEYMKRPDTIGILYDLMKGGDQAAQKRLWGFAKHWNPEPREFKGKVYPVSDADRAFREALDSFCEWEEKHGQDTHADPEDITPDHSEPGEPELPKEPEDDLPF